MQIPGWLRNLFTWEKRGKSVLYVSNLYVYR